MYSCRFRGSTKKERSKPRVVRARGQTKKVQVRMLQRAQRECGGGGGEGSETRNMYNCGEKLVKHWARLVVVCTV